MNEYLLLFRNASTENGYLTTTQDMAIDIPNWQSWIGNIAMQGNLVSTAPIEYRSAIVTTNGVVAGPHKEEQGVLVSGYVICRANSLEEAAEWSKQCPILRYPHSSVEVRPLLPFTVN